MEKFLRTTAILAMMAGLIVFGGCDEDEDNPVNPGPTTGSVAGTVTFTGSWPATGEVQVSIYSTLTNPWIPMGAPDGFTDPITPGSATYDYLISGLDKGDYMAIYVSWRDPANPAGTKLLGMYWTTPSQSGINPGSGLPVQQPLGVTINDSNLNHTGLNITADLALSQ
jgi:hypothetical protein